MIALQNLQVGTDFEGAKVVLNDNFNNYYSSLQDSAPQALRLTSQPSDFITVAAGKVSSNNYFLTVAGLQSFFAKTLTVGTIWAIGTWYIDVKDEDHILPYGASLTAAQRGLMASFWVAADPPSFSSNPDGSPEQTAFSLNMAFRNTDSVDHNYYFDFTLIVYPRAPSSSFR